MKTKKTGYYNDFMKKTLVGLVLGVAWITPGLSAGVITAAAGLYEPIVHAIANFRKEYRESIRFLFPIGLGVGIGILLFSRVMQELVAVAKSPVLYLFIGLVLGSIPALWVEGNRNGFRTSFIGAAVLTFGFALAAGRLMAGGPRPSTNAELGLLTAFACGGILAFGSLIPGFSSSLVLMYLGFYEQLLAAFTGFDLRILAFTGVGFGVIALLMLKLVDHLFSKYRGFAYYGVIGFLFASIALVFPGFRQGAGMFVDLTLFLAGVALSFSSLYFSDKKG